MDKIIKYTFFILFLLGLGCRKEKKYTYQSFLKEGYNVVMTGPLYLELNLKKSSLKSLLNDKEISDEIIFISDEEKSEISNLLFENNLLKPKGEIRIIGKHLTMPPDDDKILIYKESKLISTFYVNRNFESEYFFPLNDEKSITEVRDFLMKMLSKENKYLRMKEKSLRFLEKEGGFRM
jgi:hypothetical protein